MKRLIVIACAALLAFGPANASPRSNDATLRVGAAKIDITPSPQQLPKGMEGILDHLYVRAIVIENGASRAALVSVDTGAIGTDTWSHVSARAAKELGIPANRILLSATHTHSAPWGAAYENQIFDAIKQAQKRAQPALMAYGTGVSYINVNRNIIDPQTHKWWEGPNYDGPSDKTVAVVQFSSLSGEPIAVYTNYAVHAVLTGQTDLVSGDIPGATSRYVEESLGGDAVVLWSSGAAGDQNPIYFQQTYDLRKIRIDDYAKRGQDISNAMPPGGQGLNKQDPRVLLLMNQQKQMALSMGQMLGEEVLHVLRSNLERPTASAAISGAQKAISCPGRRQTNGGRAGYAGTYVDADPVTMQLSLLKVGDVVIGGINSEVFNAIAQRFKRESPYKHTMMVTLANGMAPSGYIPNDAAFGYETFEVLSSRLKPGCAETSIVNGLLDLMSGSSAAH
jgi:neutral ceramidase